MTRMTLTLLMIFLAYTAAVFYAGYYLNQITFQVREVRMLNDLERRVRAMDVECHGGAP